MSLLRRSKDSSTPEDASISQEIYDAKISELRDAIASLQEDVTALDDKYQAALDEVAEHKTRAAEAATALAQYKAGYDEAVQKAATELATAKLADNGVEPVKPVESVKNQITKAELAALKGQARGKALNEIYRSKTLSLIDG